MSKFASISASMVFCLAIVVACSEQEPASAGKSLSGHKKHKSDQAQNVLATASTVNAGTVNAGTADAGTADAGTADAGTAPASASGCDKSLWNHVYNPSRLQVLDSCMTVAGVIEESSADDDGDQHFLLRLDPGQGRLLEKKNAKKKGGDLVVEIVCANAVKLKKARKACPGYVNKIPIPAVGAHVSVTGSFVNDTHNSWTEIHPVSSIQPIK